MANAKEDAAEEGTTEGVKIKPDLEKYVDGVSGSGKKTKRADHPVSAALDGFTLEETYAVAQALTEISVKELTAKYSHLNVGMQRMNLGNRIRGAVAKLDKAHEADSKVVAGMPTLELVCRDPRAAVAKRTKVKAAADEEKAKAAKVRADAKAKTEAASKKTGDKKAA
jgi:hypothetical protein